MKIIKSKKKFLLGFTLIELLIAIAVSSLVAAGVFSIFASISKARDNTINQSQVITITQNITRIINRDARMMIGNTLQQDRYGNSPRLSFKTQNSLRFNRALPVTVSYYVDEDGWLVRQEENLDLSFEMIMKLVPDVSDMLVTFYDGSEYTEHFKQNARMFNISIRILGKENIIPVVRIIDGM